jgi:hypothetical protein
LLTRVEDLPVSEVVDGGTERVYQSLRKSLPKLVRRLVRDERRLAQTMHDVWGEADALYRACDYLGYEIGAAIATSATSHGPKLYALLGVHGRAVRTAAEVRHLALGRFR